MRLRRLRTDHLVEAIGAGGRVSPLKVALCCEQEHDEQRTDSGSDSFTQSVAIIQDVSLDSAPKLPRYGVSGEAFAPNVLTACNSLKMAAPYTQPVIAEVIDLKPGRAILEDISVRKPSLSLMDEDAVAVRHAGACPDPAVPEIRSMCGYWPFLINLRPKEFVASAPHQAYGLTGERVSIALEPMVMTGTQLPRYDGLSANTAGRWVDVRHVSNFIASQVKRECYA